MFILLRKIKLVTCVYTLYNVTAIYCQNPNFYQKSIYKNIELKVILNNGKVYDTDKPYDQQNQATEQNVNSLTVVYHYILLLFCSVRG